MSNAAFLLDINVLVALVDDMHTHHNLVTQWFDSIKERTWGVCALTEAGFLRVMTRPSTGCLTLDQATDVLERLAGLPRYQFWTLSEAWSQVTLRFKGKVYGRQQITDAQLLNLAVTTDGIFVTLDKAIRHMAGPEYSRNLLVLG